MKTGAWLRGGRGKIAGMVAQKSSDGKGTVLRELVTPSNPQTVDQMATRLAFGTVTQAAALMLPIIGQTFISTADEKMNRRRFVALNVPILKAVALSQQSGGNDVGSFRSKSSKSLIPNAYRVSEGSLALPAAVTPSIDMDMIITSNFNERPFQLVAGEVYNPADILASIIGFNKNYQLTFIGIYTANGEDGVETLNVSTGDFVRQSVFAGYRVNLDKNAETFTFNEQMTSQQLITALLKGFNTEKTTAEFISSFSSRLTLSSDFKISAENTLTAVLDTLVSAEDYTLAAAASIVSRLADGKWDYSNSTMICLPMDGEMIVSNDQYSGMKFNNALVEYLGPEAASKLFTRKGGLINDF